MVIETLQMAHRTQHLTQILIKILSSIQSPILSIAAAIIKSSRTQYLWPRVTVFSGIVTLGAQESSMFQAVGRAGPVVGLKKDQRSHDFYLFPY